jgi:cysteine desulfurase
VTDNLTELRERLIEGLRAVMDPAPIVLCEDTARLPNTLALQMPGEAKRIQRSARQLVMATAQSEDPPDAITIALRAIGRSDSQIGRTLCMSLGWITSRDQIDRSVEMLAEAWDGLSV